MTAKNVRILTTDKKVLTQISKEKGNRTVDFDRVPGKSKDGQEVLSQQFLKGGHRRKIAFLIGFDDIND